MTTGVTTPPIPPVIALIALITLIALRTALCLSLECEIYGESIPPLGWMGLRSCTETARIAHKAISSLLVSNPDNPDNPNNPK